MNDMEEKIENGCDCWERRLVEERQSLLEKTLRLQKYVESPDTKLNRHEWAMLTRQLSVMKEYLQVLTERCAYYNLIECEDLGIKYLPTPGCQK